MNDAVRENLLAGQPDENSNIEQGYDAVADVRGDETDEAGASDDVAFQEDGDIDELRCFDGDKGDLAPAARYACTELVRKYFISEATEGSLYQIAVDNIDDVERCLNNLYLRVRVSKRYRVVYAVSVPEEDLISGAQRMAVKRNVALKRDETILLIRLRVLQHKLEAEDPENWFVERSEMEEHLLSTCYQDDLDEERVTQRISNAIKSLCTYGYIKLVNADEQRYRIMPVLPATLDLERVHALAARLEQELSGTPSNDDAGRADEQAHEVLTAVESEA